MADVEAIAKLVNQLSKLPGIGRKTAQRLAYHIISLPEDQVRELAVSIFNGKKQVHFLSLIHIFFPFSFQNQTVPCFIPPQINRYCNALNK